ncbi:MAG: replication-associated recombination protein A [Acidobacteriota bacterium]
MDLFSKVEEEAAGRLAPLADRMRPRRLDDLAGQRHLVGPDAILRRMIERDQLHSLIFWGPPGSGKTSLARIIANETRGNFVAISAVLSGVKEIKELVGEAQMKLRMGGQRTVLFVDEIHRFNKGQQDAFLPHVESGTIILIGATTENPSFEVNSALLSRSKVYALEPLAPEDIKAILIQALGDVERGLGRHRIEVDDETLEHVREALQRKVLLYDKSGEEHFNIISALHKSLRNSDADAALYWLARMLEAGEDPLYVARRMVRFASEDVGLADPAALLQAVAAYQAVHFLGMPEGNLALAQCAVYLAAAPKSNAVYRAYGAICEDLENTPAEPVPLHLRNAVTPLMKGFGYGKGYQYAHDLEDKTAAMTCLPALLAGRRYYRPGQTGREADVAKRLEEFEKGRRKLCKD